MIGIFIALLSGALMSIQGVFNTEVTERTSIWVAGAFVQLTALIVCLAAWGITDRSSFMELKNVEPKYMLLGGAIGAFITITVIKSMEALGPARAVMLIVTAQLLVAYLIELFGIFGVDKTAVPVVKSSRNGTCHCREYWFLNGNKSLSKQILKKRKYSCNKFKISLQ